jgi:hypothetical protein
MKYVYVFGPYTNGDVCLNIRAAVEAAERIIEAGMSPYVPHLTHLWHMINPHKIGYWYQYDLTWLLKCDILLRLHGLSKGADAEVEIAKTKEIMVYYNIESLIA